MAREKVDNKLNVVIGTKAQISDDTSIPDNSIIVVTDEELKADEIVYSDEKNVKEAIGEKQDKLVAGDNITIDENTNVISASGGGNDFYRVRIFDESDKLVTTQIIFEGEKVLPLDKPGYLFDFGTIIEFDYDTVITEDIDLTYGEEPEIPSRYVQTTVSDFDASGNYTGTEEYIILPADKPNGYKIVNPNVKGVATNGNYLTKTSSMFSGNNSLYLELDYLDTSNVTEMNYMFHNSQATTLDARSFDTSNVTNMLGMFYNSQATTLDLSSFDTSSVTNMSNMFQDSQATTGYARTQTDADNFNNSSYKPAALIFVVK